MMELESYFNKTNKKSVSFRLSETVIKRLKEMSEKLNVSQAEIIELLVSALYFSGTDENHAPYKNLKYFEKVLEMCEEQLKELPNNIDMDIFGEVCNVSMGAAASAMSSLLREKVDIANPKIKTLTRNDLEFIPDTPVAGGEINYVIGVNGSVLFVFAQRDVMQFVNIWLGGSGKLDEKDRFGEMQINALAELMNQMMGQSSMALAGFLNTTIDISAPQVYTNDQGCNIFKMKGADADETVAAIMFDFTVGDIIDSKIMAVMPMPLAKEMISKAKKSFGMAGE